MQRFEEETYNQNERETGWVQKEIKRKLLNCPKDFLKKEIRLNTAEIQW